MFLVAAAIFAVLFCLTALLYGIGFFLVRFGKIEQMYYVVIVLLFAELSSQVTMISAIFLLIAFLIDKF